MHDALLTLLLLLTLVGVVSIAAPRLWIPPPIALVLVGLGVAFVPGIPRLTLEPSLILLFFLPPLLYADSFNTSWVDFRRWIRPIAMLAVGLVAATIVVVGLVTKQMFPELPWAACFILGAVVSPTDTVAAQSILERLRIPRRATAILGGESLVNDATGLVGVQIGVAVALSGAFEASTVVWQFTLVAGGGIAIGLAAGLSFAWLNQKVRDTTALFVLSLIAPYASYLASERIGASGVLAVVTSGFFVAWRIHQIPAESRVRLYSAWELITALLNGFCFLYIGLTVPRLLTEQQADEPHCLIGALLVAFAVIATRLVWVFPGAYLPLFLSPRLREREGGYPSWQGVLLTGWCGMRGAVSLAAALSIPQFMPDGSAFPGRGVVEFCTLVTIAATLLVQGLTLKPMIDGLRIPADAQGEHEVRLARIDLLRAGISRLDAFCTETLCPIAVHHLRHAMVDQLQALEEKDAAEQELAQRRHDVSQDVKRAVLESQSAALLALRDRGTINDRTYLELQIELDKAAEA
ncbi:MAG: Na+/H+ antiporter [Planctomycetes bacterium]|nr:Na+/H+ antiporter [Planctomycetota bacterium]